VLHQVGVSFDLYCDARKHKIKIESFKVLEVTNPVQKKPHEMTFSRSNVEEVPAFVQSAAVFKTASTQSPKNAVHIRYTLTW